VRKHHADGKAHCCEERHDREDLGRREHTTRGRVRQDRHLLLSLWAGSMGVVVGGWCAFVVVVVGGGDDDDASGGGGGGGGGGGVCVRVCVCVWGGMAVAETAVVLRSPWLRLSQIQKTLRC
jgi:hypothetical protein